jgi:hypothetical protein
MANHLTDREDVIVREERRYPAEEPTVATQGLRVFQLVAGAAGAVLFAFGLVAALRVDFGAPFFETSGTVFGTGFSGATAIVAILLGGALLATAIGDQDRGSTAFIGLVVLLVGIAGFAIEDQAIDDVQVDRDAAVLFLIVGAVAFVSSLVPWWTARARR